ncbi:hypothetical protein QJQ45_014473, partial [Haematococcus lacustris]
ASDSGQQVQGQGQAVKVVIAERRQVIKAALRGLVEAAQPDLSPAQVDAVVAEVNKRMTMGSKQCVLAGVLCLSVLLQSFLAPPPQAPPAGRWLDRDTNGCLNLQRIGESRQRPIELCRWDDLEALSLIGKEYQQGYKLVNDRVHSVAEFEQEVLKVKACPKAARAARAAGIDMMRRQHTALVDGVDSAGRQACMCRLVCTLVCQLSALVPRQIGWAASRWSKASEVCNVISCNPDLRSAFKFVKVCIDDLPKSFSRQEGVSALPRLSVYSPGQGRVLVLDIPFSKVKHLRKNLEVVAANPDSTLTLDPNGFVVATGPRKTAEEAARVGGAVEAGVAAQRAAEVAALEAASASMFDRLRSSAGLPASPPTPPSSPSPSASPGSRTAAGAGAGAGVGGGRAEPLSARLARAMADAEPEAKPSSPSTSSSSNGYPPALPSSNGSRGGLPGPSAPAAAAGGELAPHVAACAAQYGPAYLAARQQFLASHGGAYGYGGLLDRLYPEEVGVRMGPVPGAPALQQHYLDYTGSGVYCQSQVAAVFQELSCTMFGNPHSQNPSSSLTTDRIDEVRSLILRFFNADSADWQLVFTRSATGALKLVGETFPWSPASQFRYLRENHVSVLGMREYALQHGASFKVGARGSG